MQKTSRVTNAWLSASALSGNLSLDPHFIYHFPVYDERDQSTSFVCRDGVCINYLRSAYLLTWKTNMVKCKYALCGGSANHATGPRDPWLERFHRYRKKACVIISAHRVLQRSGRKDRVGDCVHEWRCERKRMLSSQG